MLPPSGSLLIVLLKSAATSSNWEVLWECQIEADNGRDDHLHCDVTPLGGWAMGGA
jgi:hypothetical protein